MSVEEIAEFARLPVDVVETVVRQQRKDEERILFRLCAAAAILFCTCLGLYYATLSMLEACIRSAWAI